MSSSQWHDPTRAPGWGLPADGRPPRSVLQRTVVVLVMAVLVGGTAVLAVAAVVVGLVVGALLLVIALLVLVPRWLWRRVVAATADDGRRNVRVLLRDT